MEMSQQEKISVTARLSTPCRNGHSRADAFVYRRNCDGYIDIQCKTCHDARTAKQRGSWKKMTKATQTQTQTSTVQKTSENQEEIQFLEKLIAKLKTGEVESYVVGFVNPAEHNNIVFADGKTAEILGLCDLLRNAILRDGKG
jgi:hypothetical protein